MTRSLLRFALVLPLVLAVAGSALVGMILLSGGGVGPASPVDGPHTGTVALSGTCWYLELPNGAFLMIPFMDPSFSPAEAAMLNARAGTNTQTTVTSFHAGVQSVQ